MSTAKSVANRFIHAVSSGSASRGRDRDGSIREYMHMDGPTVGSHDVTGVSVD